MSSLPTPTFDELVNQCGQYYSHHEYPQKYWKLFAQADYINLSNVIHGDWAAFIRKMVAKMRDDKNPYPTQELHNFGQQALNVVTAQLRQLMSDEKWERGNYYREPNSIRNPDYDSDVRARGEQALSLLADVDFLRSAISMENGVEKQRQRLRVLELPDWYRAIQEPGSSEYLDAPSPPTHAMDPRDREIYEAEMEFKLDSLGGYGVGLWGPPPEVPQSYPPMPMDLETALNSTSLPIRTSTSHPDTDTEMK